MIDAFLWIKKKTIYLALFLAAWYIFICPRISPKPHDAGQGYELPKEIIVLDSSLPTCVRDKECIVTGKDGSQEKTVVKERYINTDDIDFDSHFRIRTERYHLIKDDDWRPSRFIGHILSIISKLLFWDRNIGLGLDAQRSRAVLAMLESNNDIANLTVRINHNEALYDMYRLFSEPYLETRNPWLARVILGIPTGILTELWAEFKRGDYYNPLTKTVVIYSNVESISGHEIGHHRDYSRWSTDWMYALSDIYYPVRLFKEWIASQHSKHMLPSSDKWQFFRYLLIAFLTYLIAAYYVSKAILQKRLIKRWLLEKKIIRHRAELAKQSRRRRAIQDIRTLIGRYDSTLYRRAPKPEPKEPEEMPSIPNEKLDELTDEDLEQVAKEELGKIDKSKLEEQVKQVYKNQDDEERPKIPPRQTLRHLGTLNLTLYAGILGYHATLDAGLDIWAGYLAFVVAIYISDKFMNRCMRDFIPYDHEA